MELFIPCRHDLVRCACCEHVLARWSQCPCSESPIVVKIGEGLDTKDEQEEEEFTVDLGKISDSAECDQLGYVARVDILRCRHGHSFSLFCSANMRAGSANVRAGSANTRAGSAKCLEMCYKTRWYIPLEELPP